MGMDEKAAEQEKLYADERRTTRPRPRTRSTSCATTPSFRRRARASLGMCTRIWQERDRACRPVAATAQNGLLTCASPIRSTLRQTGTRGLRSHVCPARQDTRLKPRVPVCQKMRPIGCNGVLLAPPSACAAETCQWLNAATAGGILGGAATLDRNSSRQPRRRRLPSSRWEQGGASSELRIEVMTMETPPTEFTSHAEQCGSDDGAPLTGIGNEAVVCSPDDGKSGTPRRAGSGPRAQPHLHYSCPAHRRRFVRGSQTGLREKAREVAEQRWPGICFDPVLATTVLALFSLFAADRFPDAVRRRPAGPE